MMDAIDKRNQRERIARSVVKRRNIVYITQEELERKQQEKERQKEKEKQESREAAERLVQQFKDERDKKRAMEIEQLLADQEMLERQLKTGMDATGKKPMDGVTQERVEAILNEKNKMLHDIIASSSVAVGEKNKPVEVSVPEEGAADGTQGKVDLAKNADSASEAGAGSSQPGLEPDLEAGSEEIIVEGKIPGDAAPTEEALEADGAQMEEIDLA